MQIRLMNEVDILQVVEGEMAVFGETLGSEILHDELLRNMAKYYVVEENKLIIGYIGLWLTPPTGQIINFYVLKAYQNQGIGSILLEYALDLFKKNEVSIISLEVRESNINAQKLYQKYGFIKSHHRRNYYKNGEDAIVMLRGKIDDRARR